jgi:hypothetical protein
MDIRSDFIHPLRLPSEAELALAAERARTAAERGPARPPRAAGGLLARFRARTVQPRHAVVP